MNSHQENWKEMLVSKDLQFLKSKIILIKTSAWEFLNWNKMNISNQKYKYKNRIWFKIK